MDRSQNRLSITINCVMIEKMKIYLIMCSGTQELVENIGNYIILQAEPGINVEKRKSSFRTSFTSIFLCQSNQFG